MVRSDILRSLRIASRSERAKTIGAISPDREFSLYFMVAVGRRIFRRTLFIPIRLRTIPMGWSRSVAADRRPLAASDQTFLLQVLRFSRRDLGSLQEPDGEPLLIPLFFFDGGTSMAPHHLQPVARRLLGKYLQSQGLANPSAALIKAMLINGADIIPGQYTPSEVTLPPDNAQGFGRINLISSVDPASQAQNVTFYDEANALDTGQAEARFQAPVGKWIKATLVWSDPSGESLQNDLDLIVSNAAGQESHGNMPLGSSGFDRTNNVEQVLWATQLSRHFECIGSVFPSNSTSVIRTDCENSELKFISSAAFGSHRNRLRNAPIAMLVLSSIEALNPSKGVECFRMPASLQIRPSHSDK